MILIQEINEYQKLAVRGFFKPVGCMDEDHPPLACNLDENDDVYMYCLACSYKLKPGWNMYETMKERVNQYYRSKSE